MTQPPLVSICIPTYNGAKYLEETLNCAINQTYPNIEIIITDDQSTDNTLEICNNFAKKDKRIKCFQNKKNLGLIGNWCESISKSSKDSEWIKFLFQDDLMDTTTVEEMIHSAISTNVNLVLSNRQYIFERDIDQGMRNTYNNIPLTNTIFTESKRYTPEETAEKIYPHFFQNCLGEPPCLLFNKQFFKPSDFQLDLYQFMDYFFVLDKILTEEFFFINKKLIKFRVHNNSQSSKNINKVKKSLLSFQKEIHIHYYERLKLCHELLTNIIYKKVLKHIGTSETIIIKHFLISKCYYKHNSKRKEISSYFKTLPLSNFILSENFSSYTFIKYKLLNLQTKNLQIKYKL